MKPINPRASVSCSIDNLPVDCSLLEEQDRKAYLYQEQLKREEPYYKQRRIYHQQFDKYIREIRQKVSQILH